MPLATCIWCTSGQTCHLIISFMAAKPANHIALLQRLCYSFVTNGKFIFPPLDFLHDCGNPGTAAGAIRQRSALFR
jgi:hypothetical protein